jgi:hypothetical protein
MLITIYTKIMNKKLALSIGEKNQIKNLLEKLDGEFVQLQLGRKKSQRTIKQNALYWGVVLSAIQQETGHDKEELHRFFCAEYLKGTININGLELGTVASTTQLSTTEFKVYIEKIIRFAGEFLKIDIPMPEDL